MGQKSRGRERGIALFTAVWLVAAISLLALGVAREGTTVVRIAGNEIAAAKARAAAEAGLARMTFALAAGAKGLAVGPVPAENAIGAGAPSLPAAAEIVPDGRAYALRLAGAVVEVSAQAERGKIDVNAAPPALLRRMLAAAGAPRPTATARAIVTARERDGIDRGISWRLAPRDLDTVPDLLSVPGIGDAVYLRLLPLVTTRSGRRLPDPAVAPPALRALIPEVGSAGRPARMRLSEPEAFTVIARARLADGTQAEASLLVMVDPERAQPLSVLSQPAPQARAARSR